MQIKNNQSVYLKFAAVLLLMATFYFSRAADLDQFVATDEGVWLSRSADFYYALGQREFDKTFVSYHPGVVTSWIGTAALLFEFPEYRALQQGYFGEYIPYEVFIKEQGIAPLDLLVTSRVLMLVFLSFVLGLSYWFFIDLVGLLPASVAFFLVVIDPFFFALSRTFHLDAPMAVLILLSLLFLLRYLQKTDGSFRLIWLLLSGFLGGVAGLAKIPSALLLPIVVIILGIFQWKRMREKGPINLRKAGGWVIGKTGLWGGTALAAVFILWPTFWVSPLNAIQSLVNIVVGTTGGTVQSSDIFIQPTTSFFYNPLTQSYMNYLATFMWRTTPLVMFGLVLAALAIWKQLAFWEKKDHRRMTTYLLIFVILYTIAMSIGHKQSQKYFIPAYLPLVMIAGLGLSSFPAMLKLLMGVKWGRFVGLVVIISGVGWQVGTLVSSHPYYWTYYNPLLGGSEKAGKTIFVGTGEGLDEAGRYLNEKPHPEETTVFAWYGTACLSYFYDGTVINMSHDPDWGESEVEYMRQSDYLVLYSNQWFRGHPTRLISEMADIEPEKRIWIDGIEYARIYHISQVPVSLLSISE